MYDELVKRVRQVAEEVCEGYDVDPYHAEQRCFVIEEAANAIEELVGKTDRFRWIPAAERLPENQQFVLAWKDEKPKGFACICLWMDNAGWAFKNITHWMPLPEPPEPVGNSEQLPKEG